MNHAIRTRRCVVLSRSSYTVGEQSGREARAPHFYKWPDTGGGTVST